MSCIHYKFKSSLDYNSVTFDGLHLSLGDLKKAISAQKRLKPGEFDLEIINATTGDVYKKADELIAKNTSVFVSRVPVTKSTANSTQRSWEAFKQECAKVKEEQRLAQLEKERQAKEAAAAASANAVTGSEIDKIKAVIDQSTKGFELSSLQGRHPLAVPSDQYICKRCGKKGHFISNCPNVQQEDRILEQRLKRTTGIPQSMLTIVDDPLHPGALLTLGGQFAVPTVDVEGYRDAKKDKPPFVPGDQPPPEPKRAIPPELLCHICEDLCVDAAIAPCCGTSFCDECLREELLESEDHQCPSCHETNVSPDRIVANKNVRMAVTNFLNDTGYTKMKRRRSSSASVEAGLPPTSSSGSSQTPVPTQSSPKNDGSTAVVESNSIKTLLAGTTENEEDHTLEPKDDSRDRNHHPSRYEDTRSRYDRPWRHYEPRYNRFDRPRYPRGDMSFRHRGPSWNHRQFNSNVTSVPSREEVVAAAQVVQAALTNQPLPVTQLRPPHLSLPPFPGIAGFPPNRYLPPAGTLPLQPTMGIPINIPPPTYPPVAMEMRKKPIDVFDSFADFTKKKSSRTPELRSNSRSLSGSPSPYRRRTSRSFSPRKDKHSHSPRSRSRSPFRRSGSGARTPPLSSVVAQRPSKRSRSKSLTKARSRSRESRGLSELRSISPESPSGSPSLKSYVRKASKSRSPPPLKTRTRSRSPSVKRSYRSESESRSKKVRSFSPVSPKRSPRRSPLRSPRYSPKRSAYSPVSSKKSSPRRRSQSLSPKRRSPARSKSRSPLGKRSAYSRSPLRKKSYSPRRDKKNSLSPYKNSRPRSPSPYHKRGESGSFRDRPYQDKNRVHSPKPSINVHVPSPPQSQTVPTPINPSISAYLSTMGLPPPEEFFKDNPAGYEEFLRNIYAQLGSQLPLNAPTVGPIMPVPGPPMTNSYTSSQPYAAQPSGYSTNHQRQWESKPNTPPHSYRSNSPVGHMSSPKYSDRYRKEGGRSDFNRHRGNDRRQDYQRFDRNRRFNDRDRKIEYRDRKGYSDFNFKDGKRNFDKRGREEERSRGYDKNRDVDRGYEKNRDADRGYDKNRDVDRGYEKNRDADRFRDHSAGEKRKSLERKRSPQPSTKSSNKVKKADDRKKSDKRKEKTVAETKSDDHVDSNNMTSNTKSDDESNKSKTVDTKPKADQEKPKPVETKPNLEGVSVNNETESKLPAEDAPQKPAAETKKVGVKKKVGAAGAKKVKVKTVIGPNGEKKEKKIKKKKLTFGASETTDNKGLKKKKLKRVVDYKLENSTQSEDPEADKNNSDASPLKKPKLEQSTANGEVEAAVHAKTDAVVDPTTEDRTKAEEMLEVEDQPTSIAENDGVDMITTELPALSKWERDDFDDIPEVKTAVEEKPKEKSSLPRAVVDKAEKFLVEKPMKNSVIATAALSESTAPPHSNKSKDTQEKVKNGSDKYSKSNKDMTDNREEKHAASLTDSKKDSDRHGVGHEKRKDPKPKSPTHSKDHLRSTDHRAKSPVHKETRSKSPLRSKDRRSRSPAPRDRRSSRSPSNHNRDRSRTPVRSSRRKSRSPSVESRKVHVDSKKDSRDKKGFDLQITVKGDKRRKSDEGSHHSHKDKVTADEDERSVVRAHSAEKETKSSKSRKGKENGKRDKKLVKKNTSSKTKFQKSKEKAPPAEEPKEETLPAKVVEDLPKKSPHDLRHKIEEKAKERKLSVMDESEFVPDYEDVTVEISTGNKENPTPPEAASPSHSHKDSPDKSEDKNDDDEKSDDSPDEDSQKTSKHKKSKKKHKKKEKKEKHKHKKKKHKHKSKSKEKDDE